MDGWAKLMHSVGFGSEKSWWVHLLNCKLRQTLREVNLERAEVTSDRILR